MPAPSSQFPVTSYQSPVTSCQFFFFLPVTSCQLSLTSCQLQTSSQFPTSSSQFLVSSFQFLLFKKVVLGGAGGWGASVAEEKSTGWRTLELARPRCREGSPLRLPLGTTKAGPSAPLSGKRKNKAKLRPRAPDETKKSPKPWPLLFTLIARGEFHRVSTSRTPRNGSLEGSLILKC